MFTVDTIAPRGSNWVVNSSAKSGRSTTDSTSFRDDVKANPSFPLKEKRGSCVAYDSLLPS
jgi:hypothetical protein